MLATAPIIPERLAAVTHYGHGSHSGPEAGMCFMEGEAWIAGEPWSDKPTCVSPVIGAFCRSWNDSLDDEDRNRLLLPFKGRLIGTTSTREIEEKRFLMAADWLFRTHTPAWLRLAGLTAEAERLEALPGIVSMAQVPSLHGPIGAVHKDAAAAWAVARDAAAAVAAAAAGDAVLAKPRPTIEHLWRNTSAAALVERMIAA